MLKGRVILTENVVDSILRQKRGKITLCESYQLFCNRQIVNRARFDGMAAINSIKCHIFLLQQQNYL